MGAEVWKLTLCFMNPSLGRERARRGAKVAHQLHKSSQTFKIRPYTNSTMLKQHPMSSMILQTPPPSTSSFGSQHLFLSAYCAADHGSSLHFQKFCWFLVKCPVQLLFWTWKHDCSLFPLTVSCLLISVRSCLAKHGLLLDKGTVNTAVCLA